MTTGAQKDSLIAVVDDDPAVRRALERVLRTEGYTVATHACGTDLLDSLAHAKPQCIVLDLHMPGADGFEVQAALARGGWRIPVIMITGHYDARSRSRASLLGACVCLPKPVESAALLDAVSACIDGDGGATG